MNHNFTRILINEVKPATGCTAPVAVALAVARGKREVTSEVKHIDIILSKGIYKNGWGVAVPGTKKKGNDLGAALGLLIGDSDYGLDVLRNVSDSSVQQAFGLVTTRFVDVNYSNKFDGVYIEAILTTDNECVKTIIEGQHSFISLVEVNNTQVYKSEQIATHANDNEYGPLNLDDILSYIENVPLININFLKDGVDMNMRLAKDGLNSSYGLESGRSLATLCTDNASFLNTMMKARIYTCAASDARMGGSYLPAMSTAGSGNQGITAILPVAIFANDNSVDDGILLRGLALSHLVTHLIKRHVGRISSMCLCALASSAGASAAITWMSGGNNKNIVCAIKNVICTMAGMICDGAKAGCALKMGIAASEAFYCSKLALSGTCLSVYDGISDSNLEKVLNNIGLINKSINETVDSTIVSILDEKSLT